jgi:hypothetical protein
MHLLPLPLLLSRVAFAMIATMLIGCGSESPDKLIRQVREDRPIESPKASGAGTWGHLWGGRSSWLAQEAPGRTINICGDHAEELVAGISAWSRAAGRDSRLAVVGLSGESCNRSAGRTIYVHGSGKPDAARLCAKFPKAVALTYVDQSTVVVCGKTERIAEIMLHEAGHLWGMCDVYPDEVLGGSNCDSRFFTGRSRASVMGANYSRVLSAADLTGINAMVGRDDVAGNRAWISASAARTAQQWGASGDTSSGGGGEPTAESNDPIDLDELPDNAISCVLNF